MHKDHNPAPDDYAGLPLPILAAKINQQRLRVYSATNLCAPPCVMDIMNRYLFALEIAWRSRRKEIQRTGAYSWLEELDEPEDL